MYITLQIDPYRRAEVGPWRTYSCNSNAFQLVWEKNKSVETRKTFNIEFLWIPETWFLAKSISSRLFSYWALSWQMRKCVSHRRYFEAVMTLKTLLPYRYIYSISQEICTRFCCALLCCGYSIVHNEFTWSIYPYSSGLLCWHWGNR